MPLKNFGSLFSKTKKVVSKSSRTPITGYHCSMLDLALCNAHLDWIKLHSRYWPQKYGYKTICKSQLHIHCCLVILLTIDKSAKEPGFKLHSLSKSSWMHSRMSLFFHSSLESPTTVESFFANNLSYKIALPFLKKKSQISYM